MALDSIFIAALRAELGKDLIGLRVDKIQQPSKDELLFSLRGNGKNRKLLVCGSSANGRVHLTSAAYESPQTPPMFCMLMRKHLIGARITDVLQPPLERILELSFETTDHLGEPCVKRLIVELMGRYANIILADQNGYILDCLHRVGNVLSSSRCIQPGSIYRLPPKIDKQDPLAQTAQSFQALFDGAAPDCRADKWLLDTFTGLSPLICRELCFRAYGETDLRLSEAAGADGGAALCARFLELTDAVRATRFTPFMLSEQDGTPKDFSYTEIGQYGKYLTSSTAPGFSQLLEQFYTERGRSERMRQKVQSLTKTVRTHRDRVTRKLAVQREELKSTLDREALRQKGDIITANLYQMQKGMRVLTAANFYAEDGQTIEIPLDPLKTPQQNAAKYYKSYNKAKTAEKVLTAQIENGEKELTYLNSVLEELLLAETDRDVQEIRQELTDLGYVREQKKGKQEKRVQQKPMHFQSKSGFDIWVGKNNSQNDRLTLQTAFKSDLWLHTQKIHGSHVVISCRGTEPDEETIYLAAMLAAFYSQGRRGEHIPVDYTLVKHVKKPSGARPGMVIYTDYKTLFVTPDEQQIEKLKG